MKKTFVSFLVAIAIYFCLPTTASAFSQPITNPVGKGIPKTLTITLSTKPGGSFKQGDEVQFIVTVSNKSPKAITVKPFIDLYSSGNNRMFRKVELRDISGLPNEVLLPDFFDPGWDSPNAQVTWRNQVIPAKSQREFSLTAKLFFGVPEKGDTNRFYGSVGIDLYNAHSNDGVYDMFTLPVSQKKTSVITSKKKPIDHLFYAAFKHYPSDKERPYWEKRFTKLDQVGDYNRVGFLFKEMKQAAAKQAKQK